MDRAFAHLNLLQDGTHAGPLNMAIDQALLETITSPVLRVYAWDQPTVSIGFAQDLEKLRGDLPAWPVVRRWTGGGVVRHDEDVTYSVIVPMSDPWAQTRPVESYRILHGLLTECLNAEGTECRLAGDEDRKDGPVCFEAPAVFDIVRGEEKLAGAGQRRNRHGFLHQGSLRAKVGDAFWQRFAEALSSIVAHSSTIDDTVMARAQELVEARYGTDHWLHDKE